MLGVMIMADVYAHGIYIAESATALTPMTQVASPVVVVGTAMKGKVNEPVLVQSFQEFAEEFCYVDDFDSYTLEEAAYCFFQVYNVRPLICINVLDTTKHKKNVTKELSGTSNPLEIEGAILLDTVVITSGADETLKTLVKGTDYSLKQSGLTVTITILRQTNITDDTIKVSYSEVDASKLTKADVIGGVDADGKETGLHVIENIYPKLGLIPSTLIVPKYSADPEVALAMAARCRSINGVFKALALCDIDGDITNYQELNEYKTTHNLIDEFLCCFWLKVGLGERTYWLSTHAAALMSLVDEGNDDIPFESASNKSLKCDRTLTAGGEEIFLSKDKANYVNSAGIITAMNFNGWRLYGNRVSVYPNIDDVKDSFLPVRRMFNWLAGVLAVNYFSRVDLPIRKTLIESIVDEVNQWLNGLTSRGAIIGGRIAFLEEDNAVQRLIDGFIVFRIYVTPPTPARSIEFKLEYDISYLETLFS